MNPFSRKPDDEHSTVEIDGVFRPTHDSRGRLIGDGDLDKLQAFWRWFGDSRVVEQGGAPLVAYHGTDQDFEEFTKGIIDPIGLKDSEGHYFTRHHKYAENYGATIMPVYLLIENPYIAPIDGYEHTYVSPARRAELEAAGHDGMIFEGNSKNPSEYIVFNASQIKSAIGNPGTYDPNDPRITDQVERELGNKPRRGPRP